MLAQEDMLLHSATMPYRCLGLAGTYKGNEKPASLITCTQICVLVSWYSVCTLLSLYQKVVTSRTQRVATGA
jgi:hypothetical protein